MEKPHTTVKEQIILSPKGRGERGINLSHGITTYFCLICRLQYCTSGTYIHWYIHIYKDFCKMSLKTTLQELQDLKIVSSFPVNFKESRNRDWK